MVAFLYSPCVINKHSESSVAVTKGDYQEKNAILSSFYETELPEFDDSQPSTVQSGEVQQRRDIKKDPSEKAKEKLWASIMD